MRLKPDTTSRFAFLEVGHCSQSYFLFFIFCGKATERRECNSILSTLAVSGHVTNAESSNQDSTQQKRLEAGEESALRVNPSCDVMQVS